MKSIFRFSTAVIVIAWAQVSAAQTVTSGNEQAQVQPAAAEPGETPDIVVTAQRRVQRLKDVPVSVSVVSGDSIARNGLTSLADVTQRLPNVKITSGGNSDFINIRGVGSGQNPGFEQSVATFVDGVYRGRSRAARAALFDVDRIEVLKGPQTTFFGNNAIAGALNITSRTPGNTLDYNASALAGSYGEFQLESGVSAPLTDRLSVRVSGRYSGGDGYLENVFTNRDGPRLREYIGRIALAWSPTDNFESSFRFDRARTRGQETYSAQLLNCPNASCGVFGGVLVPGFDDQLDKRSAAPESYNRYDFKEAAWTNTLDLGPVSLTSITGYFSHDFNQLTQQIPVPTRGVGGGGLLPVNTAEDYESYSQELRLQSATGGTFEYMVGAYYMHGDLDTNLYTGFRFPVMTPGGPLLFGQFLPGVYTASSPISVNLPTSQIEKTKSVFGSLTIRPINRFRVNLGLRYTVVDKSATRAIIFGTSDADPAVNFVAGPAIANTVYGAITSAQLTDFAQPTRRDKKLMPSVGVQYDVTPDIMTYASFTKGFKAGGYGFAQRGDIFNPETVKAYEIGAKASLFDRSVNANLSLFLSDYSNLQESNTLFVNGQILTIINNAAEARAKGVEGSLSWRVNSMLSFNVDAAYLDARYRSYPNASCTIGQQLAAAGAPCVQSLEGRRRAYAPEWSGSVGASLNIPLDNVQLRIDPLAYFTAKYFVSPTADPLLQQSGNVKFDLRVGIGPSDRRWEMAVVGRNLSDRITSSFRSSASLPGSVYALTDPVRSVAVQFTIRR